MSSADAIREASAVDCAPARIDAMLPAAPIRASSPRLAAAFRASYDLVDQYRLGDSWMAGGCWTAAEAIRQVCGGQLVAITGRPLRGTASGIQHVAVTLPDGRLADAEGAHAGRAYLSRYAREEMLEQVASAPFDPTAARAAGIPPPPAPCVAALADRLRLRHLGEEAVHPEPDLGGIPLAHPRRGATYCRAEWTAIIGSLCPVYGVTGRALVDQAATRLAETDQARRRHGPVPERLSAARWVRRGEGPGLAMVLAKAQARLETQLTQVIPDEPAYHTRAEAIAGIQASWLRGREGWKALVDGLSDPEIYRVPQRACDRLADLEFGPLFLRAILRDDHRIDIGLLRGFTPEMLREHRNAGALERRIDAEQLESATRIDAFNTARIGFARRVVLSLDAWLAGGGSPHPPRLLQVAMEDQSLAIPASALRRPSYERLVELTVPGAGRFSGEQSDGLLREIVGTAALDPTEWTSGQPTTGKHEELVDAIRWVAMWCRSQQPAVAHGARHPGLLTATDEGHADAIAAWQAVLDVNSNGGLGVSLKSQRPAAVAFPDMARRYELAREALGWSYLHLPFDLARRMSSIPSEAAWSAQRAARGNPPLIQADRAMSLYRRVTMQRAAFGRFAGGYGNAAAAKVISAYQVSRIDDLPPVDDGLI